MLFFRNPEIKVGKRYLFRIKENKNCALFNNWKVWCLSDDGTLDKQRKNYIKEHLGVPFSKSVVFSAKVVKIIGINIFVDGVDEVKNEGINERYNK